MRKSKRTMHYKRKRKGLTNYKKRLTLLKSRKPRLVIRKSNKNIILQLIDYKPDGDIILLSTHSRELKKYGWKPQLNNLPSAYLTGLLCGNKLKKKNIKPDFVAKNFLEATKFILNNS